MRSTQILVDLKKTRCAVKMIGRPTFAVAGILRKLAKKLDKEPSVVSLEIGMSECDGMDSTIMGMLTTLALKIRSRKGGESKVLNPGRNRQLLNGLGLGKLFQYVDDPDGEKGDWGELQTGDAPPVHPKETADTILEAHKTLMEADEGNVDKFKTVVDMLEKELKE
jgi:anti-anti-sigma regulatory factor